MRRQNKYPDETTHILVGFMPGALVTLLALFYAFVLSMAEVRFEARRQFIVDEASSIEVTYLRARLLPEPQQRALIPLLKDYVRSRIDFYGEDRTDAEINEIRTRVTRLELQLSELASDAGNAHPASVPVGQFNDSLTRAFVDREEQVGAYENRVPSVVIILLLIVSTLVMASVGYAAGVSGGRHLLFTTTLSVILALTLFAILDIDRPRKGLARLDHNSLIRIRDEIVQ
ncbi:MAG: hypothetical protein ACJ763_15825 [Bdellovibrionia bacterium]